MGLWGISLGALVHSLVLLHDPRPAFVVLVQPPVAAAERSRPRCWKSGRSSFRTAASRPDLEAAFAVMDRGQPPRCRPIAS